MQATRVAEGKSINYTPSSADVAAGQVVILNSLVGIAPVLIPAGEQGALQVEGIFDVAQGAVTFAFGQAVYWDADGNPVGGEAGTGCAVESATGNTFMGFALGATLTTDETVRLALRSIESSAAETLSIAQLGDVGAVAYTAGCLLVADGNSYEEAALSGAFTLSGAGALRVKINAVTADGSAQGDAAALAEGLCVVAGADDAKGVILPAAAAGKLVIVKTTVSNKDLKVYPNTDDAINALSANAALTMADATVAIFIAADATTWYSIPLLPS